MKRTLQQKLDGLGYRLQADRAKLPRGVYFAIDPAGQRCLIVVREYFSVPWPFHYRALLQRGVRSQLLLIGEEPVLVCPEVALEVLDELKKNYRLGRKSEVFVEGKGFMPARKPKFSTKSVAIVSLLALSLAGIALAGMGLVPRAVTVPTSSETSIDCAIELPAGDRLTWLSEQLIGNSELDDFVKETALGIVGFNFQQWQGATALVEVTLSCKEQEIVRPYRVDLLEPIQLKELLVED